VIRTEFPLGDLLSVTDGRLLSPTHMSGVGALLSHMAGEPVMTHQLPLAANAMKPKLLAQHPWLKDLESDVPDLIAWLAWAVRKYGEFHEVTPVPMAWGHHDPIRDFRHQNPSAEIIAADIGEA
jgi:hypothetical protein